MPRQIVVNIPVTDRPRSIAFCTRLGFSFDPRFTDATATCMIVSDTSVVMLPTRATRASLAPGSVADPRAVAAVLLGISCDSRAAVDELEAVAAGGSTYRPAEDQGSMSAHAFRDPDGPIREPFHMAAPPRTGAG